MAWLQNKISLLYSNYYDDHLHGQSITYSKEWNRIIEREKWYKQKRENYYCGLCNIF